MTEDTQTQRRTDLDVDAWFESELERRLQRLMSNSGDVHSSSSFSVVDYLMMVIVGVVIPTIVIYLGWR